MTTVDVILFCYNQERYIEQALRSIFVQELTPNVSARIIVADDCSSDNTLNVIYHVVSESPFPVLILREEPNMGISRNYKRSFAATRADYVAVLEGDDYWGSPCHLQQHIGFLEKHQECSMSMNAITYLDEDKGTIGCNKWNYPRTPYFVDVVEQIEKGNQLGNLSACVFRASCVKELPPELYEIPIADWMLGVMMAEKGKIGLLQESTSVYRVKASGVWAGKNKWRQHYTMLRYANMYDKFQYGKYHKEWQEFKRSCWRDVRRNWMHYMPVWVQSFCHKVNRK